MHLRRPLADPPMFVEVNTKYSGLRCLWMLSLSLCLHPASERGPVWGDGVGEQLGPITSHGGGPGRDGADRVMRRARPR